MNDVSGSAIKTWYSLYTSFPPRFNPNEVANMGDRLYHAHHIAGS